MSGSVRDRLDRQARTELEQKLNAVGPKPVKPVKAFNSTTNQGGTGLSVRERAERAAFVPDDSIIRNAEYRHGGRTTVVQYVGTVRERLERQRDERDEQQVSQQPETNAALIDYYYGIHKEQQAKEQAAEAENRRKEIEAAQQRQRDAAAAKQRQEDRAKMLAVDLALASATPEEVAKVKRLVAVNFPADVFSPERHWRILQELRIALGGNVPKPEWAQRVLKS